MLTTYLLWDGYENKYIKRTDRDKPTFISVQREYPTYAPQEVEKYLRFNVIDYTKPAIEERILAFINNLDRRTITAMIAENKKLENALKPIYNSDNNYYKFQNATDKIMTLIQNIRPELYTLINKKLDLKFYIFPTPNMDVITTFIGENADTTEKDIADKILSLSKHYTEISQTPPQPAQSTTYTEIGHQVDYARYTQPNAMYDDRHWGYGGKPKRRQKTRKSRRKRRKQSAKRR